VGHHGTGGGDSTIFYPRAGTKKHTNNTNIHLGGTIGGKRGARGSTATPNGTGLVKVKTVLLLYPVSKVKKLFKLQGAKGEQRFFFRFTTRGHRRTGQGRMFFGAGGAHFDQGPPWGVKGTRTKLDPGFTIFNDGNAGPTNPRGSDRRRLIFKGASYIDRGLDPGGGNLPKQQSPAGRHPKGGTFYSGGNCRNKLELYKSRCGNGTGLPCSWSYHAARKELIFR